MSEALQRIERAFRDGSDELLLDHLDLTAVPDAIGLLSNITVLALDNNRLAELPATIGQLTALEEMSASESCLESLPPEIGRLKNLRTLYLAQNKLTVLPPEFGGLSGLRYLDLEDNLLTSLPPEIGDLSNLTYLKLARNRLTALPPEMGKLTNIKGPRFPKNQRHIVDPKIQLTLYDNPLADPPPEIRRTDDVMEYLRTRLKEKQAIRLDGKKLELTAKTTAAQYRRMVEAIVADGGRVVETLEGLWEIVTVIETRNVRLNAWHDDWGIASFECQNPEVLEYLRAFLLRNLDTLLG